MRSSECETLIVGAGVSGLAAAINLLENEYTEFLVVEASDRIGGRCFTIEYGSLLKNIEFIIK
jgi:monoamine oxidase